MEQIYETPKYRKPKASNVSKSSKKSKHKHQYLPALIKYLWSWDPTGEKASLYPAQYCSICGKVQETSKTIFVTEKITAENGQTWYRMLDNDEIRAKYPDVPIIERQI